MQPLHESGALRIQPASYFAQQDHNGAIRDDELQFSFSGVLSRDEILKLVRDPQDIPADFPEQRADMSIKSPTDYWLYCVTNSVKPRLFVDFDADACVIIRDRARFGQMLYEATRERTSAAPIQDGPALYVDPLFPTTTDLFLPFVKHFRYTYQDEHRFAWLPQVPTGTVPFLDAQIGSLKEFSDLIVM